MKGPVKNHVSVAALVRALYVEHGPQLPTQLAIVIMQCCDLLQNTFSDVLSEFVCHVIQASCQLHADQSFIQLTFIKMTN